MTQKTSEVSQNLRGLKADTILKKGSKMSKKISAYLLGVFGVIFILAACGAPSRDVSPVVTSTKENIQSTVTVAAAPTNTEQPQKSAAELEREAVAQTAEQAMKDGSVLDSLTQEQKDKVMVEMAKLAVQRQEYPANMSEAAADLFFAEINRQLSPDIYKILPFVKDETQRAAIENGYLLPKYVQVRFTEAGETQIKINDEWQSVVGAPQDTTKWEQVIDRSNIDAMLASGEFVEPGFKEGYTTFNTNDTVASIIGKIDSKLISTVLPKPDIKIGVINVQIIQNNGREVEFYLVQAIKIKMINDGNGGKIPIGESVFCINDTSEGIIYIIKQGDKRFLRIYKDKYEELIPKAFEENKPIFARMFVNPVTKVSGTIYEREKLLAAGLERLGLSQSIAASFADDAPTLSDDGYQIFVPPYEPQLFILPQP